MTAWLFSILMISKPVIELDEIIVEGEIRRPRLIQIEASRLNESLEKAAIYNLIELEKRLLEPISLEAFQEMEKSAK